MWACGEIAKYHCHWMNKKPTKANLCLKLSSSTCFPVVTFWLSICSSSAFILKKKLHDWCNKPKTNSTHIWCRERELNLGHICGRWALSPLRHPSIGLHRWASENELDKGNYLLKLHVICEANILTVIPSNPYCWWTNIQNVSSKPSN